MCTKAVSVNVRKMSDKLRAPLVAPRSKPAVDKRDGEADTLPTDHMPVITLNRPREIQSMRWGLIPHYVGSPMEAGTMFNARAETLLQKAAFKDLLLSSRCLILDEGFYEREAQGDEKVEWLIAPAQEYYFYKSGLWTTWRDRQTGEVIESFTMITCDPGDTPFRKIHDRIPIIMNKEQRRLWMDPNATRDQLMELLRPCDPDMLYISEHSRKPLNAPGSDQKGSSGPNLFS